jgi:EAL domain-containing protein (putative c-di-GMP-specific phosphodiesterase class I)/ActR/RegA family two-component response regulator
MARLLRHKRRADMRHKSALVVDDDPLFRVVMEEHLLCAGLQCVEMAEDGEKCIARVAEDPDRFDLIVCDLQMPKVNGIGVIRELARMRYSGKVIIVSGEEIGLIQTVYNMGKMRDLHVAGILKKPVDSARLTVLLNRLRTESMLAGGPVTKAQLAEDLDHKRLRAFYQPKIDLRTQRVSGFEVLCRHVADDGTVSGPAGHIEAAMTHSMMGQLTRTMIEQAIADTGDWERQIGPFGLAINMSPACILNPAVAEKLRDKFMSAGIDPRSITFEITEDRLLDNQADTLDVLSCLRLAGFNLSLDDFGTGAASIDQLRRFPFTELKIDRSFVLASHRDAFARMAVETGVRFAAALGINSVAEGIETPEALACVIEAGAKEAQGYYFSKALSPTEAPVWARLFNEKSVQANNPAFRAPEIRFFA